MEDWVVSEGRRDQAGDALSSLSGVGAEMDKCWFGIFFFLVLLIDEMGKLNGLF